MWCSFGFQVRPKAALGWSVETDMLSVRLSKTRPLLSNKSSGPICVRLSPLFSRDAEYETSPMSPVTERLAPVRLGFELVCHDGDHDHVPLRPVERVMFNDVPFAGKTLAV